MRHFLTDNGHTKYLSRRHQLLKENLQDEPSPNMQKEDEDINEQNNTQPICRQRPNNNQTFNNNWQYVTQNNIYSLRRPSRVRYQGKQYQLYRQDSDLPYCDQLSGTHITWPLILCVLLAVLIIAFVVWVIITIRKRIQTTKQYNQTPQHFIQKPTLTLNQSKNLKLNSLTPFKNYTDKDLIIENKTQFGGNIYEVKFINANSKDFSSAYWSKVLNTDCYFQLEIQQLNSQVQFGFVNRKYFGLLDLGVQKKLPRIGVILNTQGDLQLLGQIKYQFQWKLQFGDVVGIGLTQLDNTTRIWVTKNGILLNPPTSDQVQKWLTKESLSQQHRDAYYSLNQQSKANNLNKKQDNQLIKKKLTLPANQDFQYYAVVSSLEMKAPIGKKDSKQFVFNNVLKNKEQELVTTVRVNVGGKTFRLRDHVLRSGLLADLIDINEFCNCLPCF